MCGEYCINGESIRAPKALVSNDSHVEWKPRKYVSRGGQKLEAALDYFCLSPMGSVCLDAGASTGGFTDCLLKRGAKIVHAVDVGFNQIAWTLRTHKQVNVMEKTNIMKIIPGDLQPSPEFATADLSFRSLRKVATRLLQLTHGKTVLALAKPQFEYPAKSQFDGVIRSRETRFEVLYSLSQDLKDEGVYITDYFRSPVSGRKGNIEIFILLSSTPPVSSDKAEKRLREII